MNLNKNKIDMYDISIDNLPEMEVNIDFEQIIKNHIIRYYTSQTFNLNKSHDEPTTYFKC